MTRYFSLIGSTHTSHISIVVYKKKEKTLVKVLEKQQELHAPKDRKNLPIVKCNHETSYENRFNVILADIWLHFPARQFFSLVSCDVCDAH